MRISTLLTFLLCFVFAGVNAQLLDSLLERQRAADPREKIHVHFDKPFYNPGEIIWFKAYLLSGGAPSDLSKNFYAELSDENGRVLSRLSAPVSYSGATGSFVIDSNYTRGLV